MRETLSREWNCTCTDQHVFSSYTLVALKDFNVLNWLKFNMKLIQFIEETDALKVFFSRCVLELRENYHFLAVTKKTLKC